MRATWLICMHRQQRSPHGERTWGASLLPETHIEVELSVVVSGLIMRIESFLDITVRRRVERDGEALVELVVQK